MAIPEATSLGLSRIARKKRGVFRRAGIVPLAAVIAVLIVGVVASASYLMNSNAAGASSLFGAIDSLGQAKSVALLEQERQTIIEMDAAAATLTVDAKPVMADPSAIEAAANPAANVGTGIVTSVPPANPSAAEAIGKAMLPAFGFNQLERLRGEPCVRRLWHSPVAAR